MMDWLVGFIEGEGSFMLKANKCKGGILGYLISPFFSLGTSRDDINIMSEIHDYLENELDLSVGFVDRIKQGKTDACRIYIGSWTDVETLIDAIYPFMRTKKKAEVLILKDAINYYKTFASPPSRSCQIWTAERFLRMMKYVDKLQSLRSETKPRKYTLGYFKELW